MSMACNIDARGKRVRFILGVLLAAAGVGLIVFWALPVGGAWAWIVSALGLIGGGFCVFEARAGWCAIRAMGLRTPV
jgi:hypothetical protein